MIRKAIVLAIGIMFIASVNVAMAAGKGTAAEAQALVKKAVAYMKAVGKEKALAEFNNPKGRFIYKDLYVWATAMDGTNLSTHIHQPSSARICTILKMPMVSFLSRKGLKSPRPKERDQSSIAGLIRRPKGREKRSLF